MIKSLRAHILPAVALALATVVQAEVPTGDCDGWTVTSTAPPGAGSYYSVAVATLFQQVGADWVVIEVSADAGLLTDSFTDWTNPNQAPSVLLLGAPWTTVLPQGTYRIEITTTGWASGTNGAWLTESDVVTTIATRVKLFDREVDPFFCEGPPPPSNDARTPGYWKNHASAWPVLSLALGDEQTLFSQNCLLELMDLPTRGDIRVIFLHHLISAKLNILNGSDPMAITGFPTATSTILDTIIAADQYMRSEDIRCNGVDGDKPQGAAKDYFGGLKDALDAYNNNFQ